MSKNKSHGSYDYVEASDRWRWRGNYTNPVTGKRAVKSIYAKSKKELREKVEDWLIKAEGGHIELEMTFERWFKLWMRTVVADTVKIRTKETYEHVLSFYVVPKFGKIKLLKLTAQAFQEFLNELNQRLSASTVAKIRRYSIMCLDAAVRYGYISVNPLRNTRPPRQVKNEIRVLSIDELNRIIDIAKAGHYQAEQREDDGAEYLRRCYYALLVAAIDTGMRKGEVLGMKWDDVKDDHIIVRNALVTSRAKIHLDTPKTKYGARKIILGSRVRTVLNTWHERQNAYFEKYAGICENKLNLVFTNSFGGFVSGTNFAKRCWKPILSKAGIENVRFHDLRHSHASQLLAAGIPAQVVSERLGHGDVGVTLRVYAHLLPNLQEQARTQIDKIFNQ